MVWPKRSRVLDARDSDFLDESAENDAYSSTAFGSEGN
jgi:hypothetical protein